MTNTDTAGAARPSSANGATSVKEMAAAAVQSVKHEAASLASAAEDKAHDQISEKKEIATKTMGDFAAAVRKAGDDLVQHDQSVAGRVVKQAADGLEGLSRSLSEKSPGELLNAVRDFGRKNPAAFAAGAALFGLALGRFVRSSEEHGPSQTAATPSLGSTGPKPVNPPFQTQNTVGTAPAISAAGGSAAVNTVAGAPPVRPYDGKA